MQEPENPEKMLSGSRSGEGLGAGKWRAPAELLSFAQPYLLSVLTVTCVQNWQSPSVRVALNFPIRPLQISPHLLLASAGSYVHSCSNPSS